MNPNSPVWKCIAKVRLEKGRAMALARKYNQRPYRCPHCGCLHLTSKPRRGGR